ncbi:CHAP domain-containing protein [Chondromyces apiculatus]|uniref:Peptidase C51 domain-containing protein n=1 Tax=Chondromyces apiculatus DSM 436 TaxID=1192034 RepID=A0A017TFB3_9BACT|nr:CHAP domain-containing protein [Chondromyces apiculatus]EYF07505.1 Hypothetical protein CAP_0258 [Chondromyces apiculatus DSM 436]
MSMFSKFGAVAFMLAACSFPLMGCTVEMEPGDDIEAADEDLSDGDEIESVGEADQELSAEESSLVAPACNQCDNCVYYARCRQPALPYGLTSFQDKMNIVNTQTAKAGYVAIIQTSSSYGHVAYVTKVEGSKIFIAEGNWPNGQCGTRSGTKAALNIKGFFKP